MIDSRQFWISAIVVFVLAYALSFIAHGILLGADYASLGGLMRAPADMQSRLPLMILAHISFALGFTWIYLKGKEDRPWMMQGLRYGLAVAVLSSIPTYLIYHVVAPYPFDLAFKQIVLGVISLLLLGMALAWLNQPKQAVRATSRRAKAASRTAKRRRR